MFDGTFDGTSKGTFKGTSDGMFDEWSDGMFDRPVDRMLHGMFDGTFDRMFDGRPGVIVDPACRTRWQRWAARWIVHQILAAAADHTHLFITM